MRPLLFVLYLGHLVRGGLCQHSTGHFLYTALPAVSMTISMPQVLDSSLVIGARERAFRDSEEAAPVFGVYTQRGPEAMRFKTYFPCMPGIAYDDRQRMTWGWWVNGHRGDESLQHYETAYMLPTARALPMETLEELCSHYLALKHGGDAHTERTKLTPGAWLQLNVYLAEAVDLLRVFGGDALTIVRCAGLGLHELGVGAAAFTRFDISQRGIAGTKGRRVFLHPSTATLLADELAVVQSCAHDLVRICDHPGLVALDERKTDAHAELYLIAAALGRLNSAAYEDLVMRTPPGPTGQAPFFRVFTPRQVLQLAQLEKLGWYVSKQLEPGGTAHAALRAIEERGDIPPEQRAFQLLLTIKQLQALRVYGCDILEHLCAQGSKIVQAAANAFGGDTGRRGPALRKRFLEPKDFLGVSKGIELRPAAYSELRTAREEASRAWRKPPEESADVAFIDGRVAIALSFNRHAAWLATREFWQKCPQPSFHPPPRPEAEPWDPCENPDNRYIPDVLRTYGHAAALALLRQLPAERGAELYARVFAGASVNAREEYAGDTVEGILACSLGARTQSLSFSPESIRELAPSRYIGSYPWSVIPSPDEALPVQRTWENLPKGRRLFELRYTEQALPALFADPNADEHLMAVGRVLLRDRANLEVLRGSLLRDPLPLQSGASVAIPQPYLWDLAQRQLAARVYAEEDMFGLSLALGDRSLRPPGKPGKYARNDPRFADSPALLERNAGIAYRHAFFLAATDQSNVTTLAALRLIEGWPSLGLRPPVYESMPFDVAARFRSAFLRTRLAMRRAVGQPRCDSLPQSGLDAPFDWSALQRNTLLREHLFCSEMLDLTLAQGREALEHLRVIGRAMHQFGVYSLDATDVGHGDGLALRDIHKRAKISAVLHARMAMQAYFLLHRSRQYGEIMSEELRDGSLRPTACPEIAKERFKSRRWWDEMKEKLVHDWLTPYAAAYVLGAMRDDDFAVLMRLSVPTGAVYVARQNAIGGLHWGPYPGMR